MARADEAVRRRRGRGRARRCRLGARHRRESFPLAAPPEEAARRARRALAEAWVGRETAAFALPPSRLALDAGDVVQLAHDGRLIDYRITGVADAGSRRIEAVRQDRAVFALPPEPPRSTRLPRPPVWGAPDVVLMDLPQLSAEQPAHQPLVAAHARPWPGRIAVWRSAGEDGFELVTTFGSRARIGRLVANLYPGPTSRFDLGNAVVVDLLSGTIASVTDLALVGGANAFAVESAPGVWEVLRGSQAELLAPGRYQLTRLLRGQRGTEWAMGDPTPAGARVVVLDAALAALPIGEAELGLPATWRIGPALRPPSDESYVARELHARGRRPAPVLGRPCRAALAHGPRARRSRDPLDPPLAIASGGQLDRGRGPARRGDRGLRGGDPRWRHGPEDAEHHHDQRHLHRRAPDWGALISPGDALDVRIYQLSALVGARRPKPATLQV